jgi:hypothetical protein
VSTTSPRLTPTRSATPGCRRVRSDAACCSATDAATASLVAANTVIVPSPVDFTRRPPCSATAASSASKICVRSRSADSSPTRVNIAVDPTRSQNTNVDVTTPTAESFRRRQPTERPSRVPCDGSGAAASRH